jgi:hypothetical protein
MDFCEGPKKVKKKTVRRKRAFKGFQKLNSPKKKYVPGFGKKKKVCITSEKKKKSMYHSAEKKKKSMYWTQSSTPSHLNQMVGPLRLP